MKKNCSYKFIKYYETSSIKIILKISNYADEKKEKNMSLLLN